ncbi:LolA family protein [Pseudooceanicola sp. C21-150M6]|uniref:LolA family protein n=1 Tax=Pseudooceanicola sp. C21-150M6 TaxID=3434355 RepID=UPI003D7F9B5D
MNMLRPLAALAMTLTLAAPAWADKLALTDISSYLNGIKTAQAKFTQIAGDGSVSTGTLYLNRPGRMRFEYDPPNESFVLANNGAVGIFDVKGDPAAETYPLSRTPLSIILDEKVDLTRARMVTGHREDGAKTIVSAQDPAHPEYGSIDLIFTGSPVELRQWVVHDDSGSATTIVLGDMQTGIRLGRDLFDFNKPQGGDR